jgi:membrane protein
MTPARWVSSRATHGARSDVGRHSRAGADATDGRGGGPGRFLVQNPRVNTRRSLWQILKGTTDNWLDDQASSISAALAFYCAFSLAPLLIITVSIAGWIIGDELAYSYVGNQLTLLFGHQSAELILEAMRGAQSTDGLLATIVSIVMLVIGASTVFAALESALQQVWGGREALPRGWRAFVRARLISFGFILAIGFLLLVSLTLTTALAALRGYVLRHFEGLVSLFASVDFFISIALGTGLVALMYRYLPAKRLAWRHVLIGALVTAMLFHAGRWAIGLYLGRATQPTAYGAAASFAALLLWLYYSAQIFLFGAEFTACLGRSRQPAPLAASA